MAKQLTFNVENAQAEIVKTTELVQSLLNTVAAVSDKAQGISFEIKGSESLNQIAGLLPAMNENLGLLNASVVKLNENINNLGQATVQFEKISVAAEKNTATIAQSTETVKNNSKALKELEAWHDAVARGAGYHSESAKKLRAEMDNLRGSTTQVNATLSQTKVQAEKTTTSFSFLGVSAEQLQRKFAYMLISMGIWMGLIPLITAGVDKLVNSFKDLDAGITSTDHAIEKEIEKLDKLNTALQNTKKYLEETNEAYQAQKIVTEAIDPVLKAQIQLLESQRKTGKELLKDKEGQLELEKKIRDAQIADIENQLSGKQTQFDAIRRYTPDERRDLLAAAGAPEDPLYGKYQASRDPKSPNFRPQTEAENLLKGQIEALKTQKQIIDNQYNNRKDQINDKQSPQYTQSMIGDWKRYYAQLAELQAQDLEASAQAEKRKVDDTKLSLSERIVAENRYSSYMLRAMQVRNEYQKESEQAAIKELDTAMDAEKDHSSKKYQHLQLQKQVHVETLKGIDKKQNNEEEKAATDLFDKKQALFNHELQNRIKHLHDIDEANAEQKEKEIKSLTDNFNNGVISYDKYQRDLESINHKYAKKSPSEQISYLEGAINDSSLSGADKTNALEKLADIRKQLANAEISEEEAKAEKIADIKEQLKNKSIELAQQIFDSWKTIQDNQIEQEQLNLQTRERALDNQYTLDVARIKATTGFDKTEQKELNEAYAKYSAEKNQLDAEQSQLARKKAVADKQAAEAKVIMETALAEASLLKYAFDPITAAWALPAMAVVAAIGAAELAAVSSTPIPQYWKGKSASDKYEGFALVGERGPELKIDGKGNMSLTAGVPTLDYVSHDTQILPADETQRIFNEAMNISNRGISWTQNHTDVLDLTPIADTIERSSQNQIDAMYKLNRKKPVNIFDMDIENLMRIKGTGNGIA